MKKTIPYLAILILIFQARVFAQAPNTWTQVASFAAGERERMVSFSINGIGYLACGQDTADQVKNDLWAYDPMANSWTQKASLPGPGRRNAAAFAVGGSGFVGCGIDGPEAPTSNILRDFWRYNPLVNNWTQVADYPGGLGWGVYFAASFSLDTKGYVLGGKVGSNYYISDLWEYKPSADQWIQRAPFPGGGRFQHTAFGAAGKVYAGLGTDNDMMHKDWWEFNPATNIWVQKGDFQGSVRAACSYFVVNDHGFVCLGTDGGFIDDLWEYFPENDSWHIRADFPPSGRAWSSAFEIGGAGYVGSGSAATGFKRSWYKYTPLQPVGIDPSDVVSAMTIYPNPAVAGTSIRFDENLEPAMLEVFDQLGRRVHAENVRGMQELELDRTFPAGRFILVLKDDQASIIGKEILTIL